MGKIISYCYKKNFLKHLNKKKKFKKISFTSNLEDLDTCDSIVISSSTGSHINYLKKFIKKDKFLYCEKPGPVNHKELNFINSQKKYDTFSNLTTRRKIDEKFINKAYNSIYIRYKYIRMTLLNLFHKVVYTIKHIVVFVFTSKPK